MKINPLCVNITKWSNTLKQFIGKLPTNCLSVFDHFVILALKGLKIPSCRGRMGLRISFLENFLSLLVAEMSIYLITLNNKRRLFYINLILKKKFFFSCFAYYRWHIVLEFNQKDRHSFSIYMYHKNNAVFYVIQNPEKM